MGISTEEMSLLEKHIITVRKMGSVFKKTYPYLDEGAFEGDLLEHLYLIIKDGGAINHPAPDSFVVACLRNRACNLVNNLYQVSVTRSIHDDINDIELHTYYTPSEHNEQASDEDACLNVEHQEHKKLVAEILEKCTDEQKEMAQLIMEGHSLTAIAKKLGVSHHFKITRSMRSLRNTVKNPFVY